MNEERELIKNADNKMKWISDRLNKCLELEKENTDLKNKMHNMEERMNELSGGI